MDREEFARDLERRRARARAVFESRQRLHTSHKIPHPGCFEGHCGELSRALAEAEAEVLANGDRA